ncbi:ferredoxin--NADP reductase [Shewanella submarina]|uniref:2Fe-2S iron-sulfur cluster-binding protein n=1 Tax=Shewanella submarina TaxID=2016376 RepID=A0ABV7GGV6_9GAMM|nr:ferredoxin--NADP reductase [Shewanella submarina]MCL1038111.1 ferredoxin--NADP reductase [Shewanella submarina]
MSSRYHSLKVVEVIEETHDAKSLVFDVPPELAESYRYASGQFLTFRIAQGKEQLLRCYSMSSSPELDTGLRVTIKRVEGGRVSNYLCDTVRVGDLLEVMRPAGVFVPKSLDEDLLLCAGGSGVTPVFSILQTVLAKGRSKVRFIYANRDESSVIFAERLKQLAQEYPKRLQLIHLLDSLNGIPSMDLLSSLAKPLLHGRAFICGPGPFMDAMETAMKQNGMPSSKIHVERFVSLPDESVGAPSNPPSQGPVKVDAVDQAIAVVELDGNTHEIPWAGGETLLDAAEKVGVELPYSCRSGMCASCMCEVKEGKVDLLINDVLDERDLNNNLTLSCQAVPLTEKVHIRYT